MNLPNKLSFLRIVLVPIIIFFYLATFIPYGKIFAVALFLIAAITDRLDGKIARKHNLVTDLGKLLDPLADRMLYCCAMFLIVADGTIANPWGIIGLVVMFGRDTLVNGIRQVAATKGIVVAAVKSGKLKAICAYTYIPLFMFLSQGLMGGAVWDIISQILWILAYVIFAIGTVVTIWSAIDYSQKNKAVMQQANVENNNTNTVDKVQ